MKTIFTICCLLLVSVSQATVFLPSQATYDRVSFNEQVLSPEWRVTSPEYLSWKSAYVLKAWRHAAGQGVIFIGFQATDHELYRDEYYRNIAGGFAERDADIVSVNPITVGKYQGQGLIVASNTGDGMFVGRDKGRTPTMISYNYVPFEKEPDTLIWPIMILYYAAPEQYFARGKVDFDALVSSLSIAPLEGSVTVTILSGVTQEPIINAIATLEPAGTGKSRTTLSDLRGKALFENLPAGSYRLKINPADTLHELVYEYQQLISVTRGTQTAVTVSIPRRAPAVSATQPAEKPARPAPVIDLKGIRSGLGCRAQLTDIQAVTLCVGTTYLKVDAGLGFDLKRSNGQSENDLWATAGLHYLPLHSGNARLGAGLVWTGRWQNQDTAIHSFQLPFTVEYGLTPQFAFQAGIGPAVSVEKAGDSPARIHWQLGKGRSGAGLGFTWYFW